VPDRLHYGTNARTLDFVIEAKSIFGRKQDAENKGGTHGNDARVKTYTLYFRLKILILNR
jgi:hypothetical protein